MGAFTGKTVLILGGSRGIGAAIVRRFVTDGANVRFTYAGSKDAAERLAQETGATAVFTDSADRDAVSVAEITDYLGINPPSLYAAFGSKAGLF
ncbi:SDR family NAD(P)-dependent oxidoreductase, partial [Escherichia coli]|uniref:SDR family NAD(P)-dependent oxidoreductase n=1 Tax=Escherichia coli TaxID=562 RepID=UPI00186B9776